VRPVEASWRDAEAATASFTAKTIPPVTPAGAPPSCSWNTFVTTTSVSMQWSLPAGYSSTAVRFVAQKGTSTQVITGGTTTVSGGVYTTTIPVSLLNAVGSLLGGVVVIHVAVVDPSTGWVSKPADYAYTMSLAGIVTSCSATPAGP
jgi:hypothetical protein